MLRAPARPRTEPNRTGAVVAGCVAVATASLVVPARLGFDPWAWLVWGREVGRLDLDTTGGPSWKPLAVAVTTILAPLGDHAETAWMVAARAGGLLAVVATFRLASRLAGPAAGLVAACLLVLTPDADPRFVRLLGEGHAAPTSVALLLFAVDRHLGGRRDHAMLLATAAGLLRPEVWPFLLGYALWSRRAGQLGGRMVVGCLLAVPLLWFVPDWWGSGSPWHGADAAQVAAEDPVWERLRDGVAVTAAAVPVAAWPAAAYAVVRERRRRGPGVVAALAAGAAAWAAVVVAMSVALGYAALSRFLLPTAAVVCVLAGAGTVRAVRRAGARTSGRAVLVAALAIGAALTLPRLAGVASVADEVASRVAVEDDLDHVLGTLGTETLLACDDIAVEVTGLLRSSVPWKLDLPLRAAPADLADGTGVMLVRTGSRRDRAITRQDHTTVLLRSSEWSALAVRCPSARGSALPDS